MPPETPSGVFGGVQYYSDKFMVLVSASIGSGVLCNYIKGRRLPVIVYLDCKRDAIMLMVRRQAYTVLTSGGKSRSIIFSRENTRPNCRDDVIPP